MSYELRDEIAKAIEKGLTDDALKEVSKQVSKITTDFEDEIEYFLKEELSERLSDFVVEMAGNVVKAILKGNQSEMERYLGCGFGCWTGRSDSPQYGRKREDHEWHPVIHGKLFEQGAVKLRKDLTVAHADFITNQRILDLEDQVRSLVAQVNKANSEKEAMWERVKMAAKL